jgi:hypothetical protein
MLWCVVVAARCVASQLATPAAPHHLDFPLTHNNPQQSVELLTLEQVCQHKDGLHAQLGPLQPVQRPASGLR